MVLMGFNDSLGDSTRKNIWNIWKNDGFIIMGLMIAKLVHNFNNLGS